MKRNFIYCILLIALVCPGMNGRAQKKLLILGSSTSACYNIQFDSCYVGRLQRYYQLAGSPVTIDNRAVAGDNCYHGMPLTYTPPVGRNAPRPYNNITEGLQGNPDIVLVNYPSNAYDVYSVEEVLFCLRTIKQTANNAGKPCYITTSQPRSEPASFRTPEVRQKMQLIKESIINEFGQYAINFWEGIVNTADNSLLPVYNSGDGTHLTSAGHNVLFNQVVGKNIFSPQQGGLSYRYYEGNWNALPDFNALTPVKTGTSANTDLGARNVNDYFGFVWEGYINITTPGTYNFETVSDDGSKFYFNSFYSSTATALVNNDGTHGPISAYGSVYIPAAGRYPVAITFFEKNVGEVMQLYWSGPGIQRQIIPDNVFTGTPSPSGGLSYRYYEGNWNALPDFNALTPVKTGTSANVDLGARNVNDYFGFVWEGYINITTPGTYNFETISDDGSKFYFNSSYSAGVTALVNNDGTHGPISAYGSVYIAAAGRYPVAITFFEKNIGEVMQLYWSGPNIQRQQIPDNVFTSLPVASSGGLNYKYYEGEFYSLPDFNALTPVKTGTSANLDLGVRRAGVNDRFALMWNGYINLPVSGTYTFETISDDGSKLYFDMPYSAGGSSLVNNDGLHGPYAATGTVTAAAGKHPVTITFFEKDGGETMQLYWTGPGFGRQPVPDAAFSVTGATGSTTAASATQPKIANVANEPGGDMVASIYPNPFAQDFTIRYYNRYSAGSSVLLHIYDVQGRLIYTYRPANLAAGNNSWNIQVTDKKMVPGVYTAQLVVDGTAVKTLKLVKMK